MHSRRGLRRTRKILIWRVLFWLICWVGYDDTLGLSIAWCWER